MKGKLPRLHNLTDDDLARLWVRVMDEMRDRDMTRSANNPVADRAERVVADLYGVEPSGGNKAGYDLITKSGRKVQVKGLRMTTPNRSTLSPVRSPDYHYLVAVRFERDFTLKDAWRFTRAAVEDLARWSKHV